jgi:protein TonB
MPYSEPVSFGWSRQRQAFSFTIAAACTLAILLALHLSGRFRPFPEPVAPEPLRMILPTVPAPIVTPVPEVTKPSQNPTGGGRAGLPTPTQMPTAIDLPVFDSAPIQLPSGPPTIGGSNGTGQGLGRGDGAGGNGTGSGAGKPVEPTVFLPVKWVVEPGFRELFPYYPDEARREGISGKVTLACQVRKSRRLKNCYVLSETPKGHGFGAGVLAASRNFRVYPPTKDGKALEEAWIAVTIGMAVR